MYGKLVAKVNNINTNYFVLKTKYDADKSELEKKLPDTSGLVKKTDYNTKNAEIENKILDISNSATKTALNTVENKIPSVVVLLRKGIMTQKLLKSKTNLIIIIMINILQLQSLIL